MSSEEEGGNASLGNWLVARKLGKVSSSRELEQLQLLPGASLLLRISQRSLACTPHTTSTLLNHSLAPQGTSIDEVGQ